MNNKISYPKLLKWFLIEEWKMYLQLFGNKRIYMFPIVLFLFGIGFGLSVTVFNISVTIMSMAYFAIVVLFGVQTGSIGFEAEDAISNLLGDSSRILYTSRYLPISQRKLVGVFIIKDVLFYTIVIMLPVVIGISVGILFSPFDTLSLTVMSVLQLYIITVMCFVFGITLGFMITTISFETKNKSRISKAIIATMIIISSFVIYGYSNIGFLTIYQNPYIASLVMIFLSVIFLIFGLIQFKNETTDIVDKKYKDFYPYLRKLLFVRDYDEESLMISKYLTDIKRSAGGFWKIIFSSGIITLSGVTMILIVGEFIPTYESYPMLFGVLIGLVAYPVYTVIFRYDDIDSYQTYPISKYYVVKSKVITFFMISIPISLFYYALLMTSYDFTYGSLITGIILIIGLLTYQYGILMYIVKDKPLEFLFDGMLFSIYSILTMIVLIPLLVIGLYGTELTSIHWAVNLSGVILFIAGMVLIYKNLSKYK